MGTSRKKHKHTMEPIEGRMGFYRCVGCEAVGRRNEEGPTLIRLFSCGFRGKGRRGTPCRKLATYVQSDGPSYYGRVRCKAHEHEK